MTEIVVYKGRPEFISREVFRAYLSKGAIDKLFTVGRILPSTFIAKYSMPHVRVNGQKRWRPIDVVAKANALNLVVGLSKHRKISDLKEEIYLLEQERDEAKHKLCVDKASLALTGKSLWSESEVVEFASGQKHATSTGVYFLVQSHKVCYVGQSVNVHSRVSQHPKVDSWAYIPCERSQLNVLESLYIHMLRPEGNGEHHITGEKVAPMSIGAILAAASS